MQLFQREQLGVFFLHYLPFQINLKLVLLLSLNRSPGGMEGVKAQGNPLFEGLAKLYLVLVSSLSLWFAHPCFKEHKRAFERMWLVFLKYKVSGEFICCLLLFFHLLQFRPGNLYTPSVQLNPGVDAQKAVD